MVQRLAFIVRLAACGAIVAAAACGDDEGSGDATPPSLLEVSLSPDYASASSTITVTFTTSEPLSLDPTVRLALESPRVFSLVSATGNDYELSYALSGDEPEGEVTIEADLVDEAGNATTVGLGTLTIDLAAPTPGELSFGSSPYLRAGVTGVVSFNATETLAGGGVATFVDSGNLSGVELEVQHSTSHFSGFAYTPTGEEAEGLTQIEITITDLAGNSATSGPFDAFILDFTAPSLAAAPNLVTPVASIGAGDRIEVQFSSDEALDDPRIVARLQGGSKSVELIATSDEAGLDWTATRAVNAAASFSAGMWDIEGLLSDRAGNIAVTGMGTVEIQD